MAEYTPKDIIGIKGLIAVAKKAKIVVREVTSMAIEALL